MIVKKFFKAMLIYGYDRRMSSLKQMMEPYFFMVLQVEYGLLKGLRGAMVWSIDTDDFDGACGGSKYPLLQSINYALAFAANNSVEVTSSPPEKDEKNESTDNDKESEGTEDPKKNEVKTDEKKPEKVKKDEAKPETTPSPPSGGSSGVKADFAIILIPVLLARFSALLSIRFGC